MVGIGVDTVEVERFRSLLERTPGLLDRLFTEGEKEYGARHNDSAPHMAARFAAKEAAMKAMGVGLGAFGFHDVEVVSTETGAPELSLHGAAATLSESLGVAHWRISLTHTCSSATAMVIAE